MFLVITCCGLLFAVLETIGLAASFGVLPILTLVGLHVVGNALGTSLRDEAKLADGQEPDRIHFPLQLDLPPDTRLRQHARLGWVVYLATLAGALAGAYLGVLFLRNIESASTKGIVLGAISSGVLGGFLGFLYGSFFKTWLSAWWQASAEAAKTDGIR
jgi:hypothetical protein